MKKSWKVPEIWPKSKVFVLGGGPSLLKILNGKKIENYRVIGVNNCYELGDWVDVAWFGDSKWFQWYHKEFAFFSGLKATCAQKFISEPKKNIKVLLRGKPQGLETDPRRVSWNRSSGGSAVNLATLLGAQRVVLIGFDMRLIGGVKNWKPHPKEITKPNPYIRFSEPFKKIMIDAKKLGIEIVNTSPKSGIKEWVPEVNLEKELK